MATQQTTTGPATAPGLPSATDIAAHHHLAVSELLATLADIAHLTAQAATRASNADRMPAGLAAELRAIEALAMVPLREYGEAAV